MFEREHHRCVGLVLQALEPDALSQRACYFGGGTAMALLYGEYRESLDIDFLVSNLGGYRELRQALGGTAGLTPLLRPGMALDLAREVRADQYGIRTQVRAGGALIKFEIVLEARIPLDAPAPEDRICGIQTLSPVDLAAGKLLANADRWREDSVFSRDLIDLAMQQGSRAQLEAACAKSESAYGVSVRGALASAVEHLRHRPQRLAECMRAMRITTVSRAQLWGAIRRLARVLPPKEPQGRPEPR